jgi:hypothetical protein
MTAAQLSSPFTPALIAAVANPSDIALIKEFNRARQSVKATVENANAGVNRLAHAGDQRKQQSSLIASSTGFRKSIVFNKLAVYMYAIGMRMMRNQTHASNSQLFKYGLNGPGEVLVSLARTTYLK